VSSVSGSVMMPSPAAVVVTCLGTVRPSRAPSVPVAERRLKECTQALEDFAERVYQARERP